MASSDEERKKRRWPPNVKNSDTKLMKEVFRHLLKCITVNGSKHVTVNRDAPRLESLGNRFFLVLLIFQIKSWPAIS